MQIYDLIGFVLLVYDVRLFAQPPLIHRTSTAYPPLIHRTIRGGCAVDKRGISGGLFLFKRDFWRVMHRFCRKSIIIDHVAQMGGVGGWKSPMPLQVL